jgi:hypothetical protein
MKLKIYGVGAFLLAVLWALEPANQAKAFDDDDMARACRTQAAVAMHVSRSDVDVRRGENVDDGTYILRWEARMRDGNPARGYCQVDPRQRRIIRFDTNEYAGSPGGRDDHRDEAPIADYPRVRADTPGAGSFDGGRFRNIHLESVYLDTRERPMLVLRGVHEFRIAFYGEIVGLRGDRDLTLRMRIGSSDHGDVHGVAEIRLNEDRHEVEAVEFHGRIDGDELNSNFVWGR